MSAQTSHLSKQVTGKSRSLRLYAAGFASSIVLTVGAFALVELHLHALAHSFSRTAVIVSIVTLALVQCALQLMLFLHLGAGRKSRWKLFVFLFMLMVVAILVFGSLWIMSNLTYRMTPQQMQNYMNTQDGL